MVEGFENLLDGLNRLILVFYQLVPEKNHIEQGNVVQDRIGYKLR